MKQYEWLEWLFSLMAIVLSAGAGRFLASRTSNDKRRAVGGIATFIGVIMTLYGVNSLSSISSQLQQQTGKRDVAGLLTAGLGLLIAIFGAGALLSKHHSRDSDPSPSLKE